MPGESLLLLTFSLHAVRRALPQLALEILVAIILGVRCKPSPPVERRDSLGMPSLMMNAGGEEPPKGSGALPRDDVFRHGRGREY